MTLGCLLKKWSQRWIVRTLVPLPISFRNILYLMHASVYHCRNTMWICSKKQMCLVGYRTSRPRSLVTVIGAAAPQALRLQQVFLRGKHLGQIFSENSFPQRGVKCFPWRARAEEMVQVHLKPPWRKLQPFSLLQAHGNCGLCCGTCPPLIWGHCPLFLGELGSVGKANMMLNVHRRGALLR